MKFAILLRKAWFFWQNISFQWNKFRDFIGKNREIYSRKKPLCGFIGPALTSMTADEIYS